MVGKTGFAISVFILYAQGRLNMANVFLPAIDLILAILFAWAFFSLKQHA
jgi:hypothetical protein